MAVLEMLTEEECYLWAILSDPSGLDQAEFSWTAMENDDLCFRAWPYQWKWWRDRSPQQIDQCGRSVGKSLSIKVRSFAFPFIHPGQEMVITAPEGNHLDAITDVIETAYLNNRLGREMLATGRRGGITHRPFHMNFANGARIMGRIPQRDGKGVKGIHPIWLELDEAQDYPDAGWVEIFETVKQGHEGAMWRAHGVTRGLRDYFYKFTQPDSGWSVHRYCGMHRPTWTDEERQSQIAKYGSRDHPDYRRNVMGLHGDTTNPLFVLHRLMACVDTQTDSDYNTTEYYYKKINNEMVLDSNDEVLPWLQDIPRSHLADYKQFWIGMDVGYTNDPSAIVVFAESKDKKNDQPKLKLISRILLERIKNPHQVEVILYLLSLYKPRAFSMDKTGVGLPLYQDLQERTKNSKAVLDSIKGYNFSSKILVDFDQAIEIDEMIGDPMDAKIERNVLEYSSDKLRQMVDQNRIILPWDKPLISEFQLPTWTANKSGVDMYGRKKSYSKGSFHTLDATRMAVLGYAQYAIEEMTKQDRFVPAPTMFLQF